MQRGQAWADANYALSTVSDALQFIMEQIAGLFCVSDFPFFIAENVCEGTKSFIYLVFLWIWKAVDMVSF